MKKKTLIAAATIFIAKLMYVEDGRVTTYFFLNDFNFNGFSSLGKPQLQFRFNATK